MRIFIFKEGSLIADHQFDPAPLVLGAGIGSAIHLSDSAVAEKHLRFEPCDDDAWNVTTLDDEAVALHNGSTIHGTRPLRDLDEIAIGPFTIKVYLSRLDTFHQLKERPREVAERAAKWLLPSSAVSRIFNDPFVFTPDEYLQYADLTCDMARITTSEMILDAIIPRARKLFESPIVCVHFNHRTASSFEMSRATDGNDRPLDIPQLSDVLRMRHTQFGQCVCLPTTEDAPFGSVMAAPIVGRRGRIVGHIYVAGQRPGQHDVAHLTNLYKFASAVAAPIEHALHSEACERAEMSAHEIAAARVVQDALTLQAMPNWSEIQVACYRRQGEHRCTDHYDLLRLANRTVSFMLARVTAPATLVTRLMSAMHATFRTSSLHADPPHVFCRTLNWLIHDMRGDWSIDLAAAWLSPGSSELQYCVAGRDVSLVCINSDGEIRSLSGKEMPAIGASRGFNYSIAADPVGFGDMVALISSGADKLANAEQETFGRDRVAESLADMIGRSPTVALAEMREEIDEFGSNLSCPDDMTVLLLRNDDQSLNQV